MSEEPREKPQTFPVTRWTLVKRAAAGDVKSVRVALDELLRAYLPALKTHLVLSRRLAPERADDLLQSFVTSRVLEQSLVSRADRNLGKFRTFLLSALNNFLIDQYRADHAKKRAPDSPISDVHENVADSRTEDTPADSFETAWAKEVLHRAIGRTRKEFETNSRPDLWAVLHGRVISPALDGAEPESYESLLAQFKFATPDQASNALVTAKRTFVRVLRDVIGEYASDEEEIEEELRDLKSILARGGG